MDAGTHAEIRMGSEGQVFLACKCLQRCLMIAVSGRSRCDCHCRCHCHWWTLGVEKVRLSIEISESKCEMPHGGQRRGLPITPDIGKYRNKTNKGRGRTAYGITLLISRIRHS
jgi:hypothetical protein